MTDDVDTWRLFLDKTNLREKNRAYMYAHMFVCVCVFFLCIVV